jgi:hypothetical protein
MCTARHVTCMLAGQSKGACLLVSQPRHGHNRHCSLVLCCEGIRTYHNCLRTFVPALCYACRHAECLGRLVRMSSTCPGTLPTCLP